MVNIWYEAYSIYPNPKLTGLMAVLKLDEAAIHSELTKRLADKPLAREFILLDWLGMDRTAQVKRIRKVQDITSYDPREEEPEDIEQGAILKSLELW